MFPISVSKAPALTQVTPRGSSPTFHHGVFTQNERSNSFSTCTDELKRASSLKSNLYSFSIGESAARYNRKRKKEKNACVSGYVAALEASALSIRRPRRKCGKTTFNNIFADISAADERALKNLGWSKVLRSHCGLNHSWYFPPLAAPFVSEAVTNLHCFSSLDGGEMQKHLTSNPMLLEEDFSVVWERLMDYGWDYVIFEEEGGEGEEVKYYKEFFFGTVLREDQVWGIHRFCSREAVLKYIARFPYPLQSEEEFIATLKRHDWLLLKHDTIPPGARTAMSYEEARHRLWERPQLLFASYWMSEDEDEGAIPQDVFIDFLRLSSELAKQREFVTSEQEESPAIADEGHDVIPRGENDHTQQPTSRQLHSLADSEIASDGGNDYFLDSLVRNVDDSVAGEHLSDNAERSNSRDSSPIVAARFDANENLTVDLRRQLVSSLARDLPQDWDEAHGVEVWGFMESLGWRRQKKDEYSSEYIFAPWVHQEDEAEEVDISVLTPGLDYFTANQDEDILFAMLTSWYSGERDVHLVLRLGVEKLDAPHRSFSYFANLWLERESVCKSVLAQVTTLLAAKGASVAIDDLLPFMLRLGWEVKYGEQPSRLDELVDFKGKHRKIGFAGVLLPPWTIYGYRLLSDEAFYKPAARPIDLEKARYNLDYFDWADSSVDLIVGDAISSGAETLLLSTLLRHELFF